MPPPATKKRSAKRVPASTATAASGLSKKARQSRKTREKILDAAEKLFAGHGYHGVSIREVASAVDIDTSLLHYHFGNKQGLFDAVFDRRSEIANRLRMESMDAYERRVGDKVTVEGALEAFLMPLMELLASGDPGWKHAFALIAQISNTSTWGGSIMAEHFDQVVKRLIALLRKALPEAPTAEIYWSYHFFVGALMMSLADTGRIEPLSGHTLKSSDVEALAPRMVAYAAAGIRRLCRGDMPSATPRPALPRKAAPRKTTGRTRAAAKRT